MSVLELKDLSKAFNGVRAVNALSLGFEEGKITALIGPNGAGKTTVFNLICGFLHPDRGAIKYRRRNIVGLPTWHIASMGIGRLFQDARAFNGLSARQNVLVAFKGQRGESAIQSLVNRWKVGRQERSLELKAAELLRFVRLEEQADALAENLSFGQQKLMSIARLLAADADLLLLDEPTAGVAPFLVDAIIEVISELAAAGKTVIIIEHNLNVVYRIADWIYFIDEGRVVSSGPPDKVLNDPEIKAAYLGL
jgi:branched-chain amino acid transport system permease protein